MWNTIGHDWAVRLLQRCVGTGKLSHAYLLVGPPQVGKTTLALDLARALNCVGTQPPCGRCAQCRKAQHGVHPDIRVVEREGASLRIEQVRALQHDAALTPVEGRYKVFVLLDVERATPEAANCLLKTLEEPPASVVLILTASDSDLLLPTVVSRCQVLGLRAVDVDALARALVERWGVPAEDAARLARLSGGRPGWAVAAAGDPAVLERRSRSLENLVKAFGQDLVDRWRLAERMAASDAHRDDLDVWLSWWRDAMLVRAGRDATITNLDRRDALTAVADRLALDEIAAQTQRVRTTIRWIGQNVNARLALEVLMMDLPVLAEAGGGIKGRSALRASA